MAREASVLSAGVSFDGFLAAALFIDVERLGVAFDDFRVDDDFDDAVERRQFEHRIKQNAFHDGAKAARAGLARDRLARHRRLGVFRR